MTDVSEDLIDEIMAINFKGAFFTVQKAAFIIRNGSSIVFNTSVNNQPNGNGRSSIYTASKVALRSLTLTLTTELVEPGIRVNAVSPGPVATPIYGKLGVPQDRLNQFAQQLQQQIPMHRFGQPEEIAKAVFFLASDDSSFVLGEELVVDGGWTEL